LCLPLLQRSVFSSLILIYLSLFCDSSETQQKKKQFSFSEPSIWPGNLWEETPKNF